MWDWVAPKPSRVGMRFYRGTLVRCHCGEPAVRSEGDEDGRMDAYCDRCTSVRCDAFPGACAPAVPVVHPEPGDLVRVTWLTSEAIEFESWAEVREDGKLAMLAVVAEFLNESPQVVSVVRPVDAVAAAVAAVRADVVLTLQTMAHGRPHYLSPALESTRQATLLEAAAAIEALP